MVLIAAFCSAGVASIRTRGLNQRWSFAVLAGSQYRVGSSPSLSGTIRRDYSSSTSSSDTKTTFWRRLVNIVKLLTAGSKQTIKDTRDMLAFQKKGKAILPLSGKAPRIENYPLSRAELQCIFQVRRDLSKCLSVIVLFWIPFIGYFAIAIILLAPRKVLSRRFLTNEKLAEYMGLDYQSRRISATKLANRLVQRLPHLPAVLSADYSHNKLASLHDMLKDEKRFNWAENMLLSSSLGLFPYLPNFLLKQRQRKFMHYIFTEDYLIKLEGGPSKLSSEDLLQACYCRGLIFDSSISRSDLSNWLEQWIQHSTSFQECPVLQLSCTASLIQD